MNIKDTSPAALLGKADEPRTWQPLQIFVDPRESGTPIISPYLDLPRTLQPPSDAPLSVVVDSPEMDTSEPSKARAQALREPVFQASRVIQEADTQAAKETKEKQKFVQLPDASSAAVQRTVRYRAQKNIRKKDPQSRQVFECKICDVKIHGPVAFENHQKSKKHLRKANFKVRFCKLCNISVLSEADWQNHTNSKSHRTRRALSFQ